MVSFGGYLVEFVIDSGVLVNIIDKELWEVFKKKCLKCYFEKCEKKFYVYSFIELLKLLGKFWIYILIEEIGNGSEEEFYVLNGKGLVLLGKDIVMNLGVFKFGVNSV